MSTSTSLHEPLPAKYIGVWQRTLLQSPSSTDTTSIVLWMQTQYYHIDIRIPANLHHLSKANQLKDYAIDELYLLAQQQGFAGITQVDGDICQWHREMDFQPVTQQRDVGKMVFETPNFLIETGLDADYLEHWQRLTNSQNAAFFKCVKGTNRHGVETPAYLMRAGQYIAYARPRSVVLPQSQSLMHAINLHNLSVETLCDWLDMEISFGEILNERSWQIKYSTLPFKQGLMIDFQSA